MKWNVLFFGLLLLAALACGTDSLPDVSIPEGAAATAQQGARQAATAGAALVTRAAEVTIPAGALATARAAGGAAATAVAGGGDLVATVQAVGPQINVSVNTEALREKLSAK